MRGTIALGIPAWPVRYAIFAIAEPTRPVMCAQTLQGFCYSIFCVGGMISAVCLSRREMRVSAQGLIVFATNGLEMFVGHFSSGQIHDCFALEAGGYDWAKIFLVAISITLGVVGFFLFRFQETAYIRDSEAIVESEGKKRKGSLSEGSSPISYFCEVYSDQALCLTRSIGLPKFISLGSSPSSPCFTGIHWMLVGLDGLCSWLSAITRQTIPGIRNIQIFRSLPHLQLRQGNTTSYTVDRLEFGLFERFISMKRFF